MVCCGQQARENLIKAVHRCNRLMTSVLYTVGSFPTTPQQKLSELLLVVPFSVYLRRLTHKNGAGIEDPDPAIANFTKELNLRSFQELIDAINRIKG